MYEEITLKITIKRTLEDYDLEKRGEVIARKRRHQYFYYALRRLEETCKAAYGSNSFVIEEVVKCN